MSNDQAENPRPSARLPTHVIRLAALVLVLAGITLAGWTLAIPAAYTDSELHRTTAIDREVERPIKYAGASVCRDCHDYEAESKVSGFHRNVSCETCHGPLYAHSEDPIEGSASVPQRRDFCPVCHAYDPSRPTGYPQISPIRHNPALPCAQCHDPHAPKPPETPHECSACHAQISNTKAVSHHVLVECTTCHETPEQHRLNPLVARPSQPQDRAFCGQCHSEESDRRDAPSVDIDTHEEKYLCWQCHYPHLPESR